MENNENKTWDDWKDESVTETNVEIEVDETEVDNVETNEVEVDTVMTGIENEM